MDERLLGHPVIVFDIGNVLLRFDPQELAKIYFPAERFDALFYAVFRSGLWPILDTGLMGMGELARKMYEAIPGEKQEADYLCISRLLNNFHQHMTPMKASGWLKELKAAGKKLYYLTNYGCPQLEETLALNPFFSLFDGGVVSAREHVTKPASRIFRILCERYGFDPRDALFIDDSKDNTDAALKEGFHVWHYTDKD